MRCAERQRPASSAAVATACVAFTPAPAPFRPALPAAQFIRDFWAPLAAYVKAQEPGTLAYEIMVADTDPLKIQVFER